jgi:hypothetical protein
MRGADHQGTIAVLIREMNTGAVAADRRARDHPQRLCDERWRAVD